MSRKLAANSLSATVLYVTNICVAFIMSPVLIRALGNRDYGLWELVLGVIGYMGILDLGVGAALVRFVSVEEGRKDQNSLQETVSTAFFFFVIIGIVAGLILIFICLEPQIVGGGEITDIDNLSLVFFLLAVNALFQFPQQVFTATLMGVQRHYFINNVRVVIAILQAVLIYILLLRFSEHGLVVLASLTLVFTVVMFLSFAWAVCRCPQIPPIRLSSASLKKAREMAFFAGKSALMLVASRLQSQSVPIIISQIIGLSSIVYFSIPNQLMRYARGLSLAIAFPLAPYFGAAVGKGDHLALVDSWLKTTKALQVISLAMPVFLIFLGGKFLELWIGAEYSQASYYVLYILAIGLIADSLSINAYHILTANNRHGSCTFGWLIISALSIPCGIMGAYMWGIEGVTFAAVLVTVVGNIMTLFIACRVMSVKILDYLRKTVSKSLLPLFSLSTGLYILKYYLPINDYYSLFIHAIFGGMIYLALVIVFAIETNDRRLLFSKIKYLSRKVVIFRGV